MLDQRIIKTVVTLRCDTPFTMTVTGMKFIGEREPDEFYEDGQRYFYEESTCPINAMRCVTEIFDGEGREDPHGLFKFVKVEVPNE